MSIHDDKIPHDDLQRLLDYAECNNIELVDALYLIREAFDSGYTEAQTGRSMRSFIESRKVIPLNEDSRSGKDAAVMDDPDFRGEAGYPSGLENGREYAE